MNRTIDYYNKNAKTFAEETITADISNIRKRFELRINSSSEPLILDWGCGSGRDTLEFIKDGFNVEAVDASRELCEIASEYAGINVRCESFYDLDAINRYDGIWACASLLHLQKKEIPNVITIAKKALKPSGILYASFKYGDFEGEEKERHFAYLTESGFDDVMKSVDGMKLIDIFKSTDVRRGVDVDWLNVMLEKSSSVV